MHIDRQTTKFPDMSSSAKVCAQLRGGAAKTGRLFFHLLLLFSPAALNWITLWITIHNYTLCKVCLPMYVNMKRLPQGYPNQ